MQAVGKNRNKDSYREDKEQSQSSNEPTKSKSKPKSKPKSVELHGITINFPFEPYPCQEKYMSHVIQALHRSENALLESPTVSFSINYIFML